MQPITKCDEQSPAWEAESIRVPSANQDVHAFYRPEGSLPFSQSPQPVSILSINPGPYVTFRNLFIRNLFNDAISIAQIMCSVELKD
jgi:hypothetical protein